MPARPKPAASSRAILAGLSLKSRRKRPAVDQTDQYNKPTEVVPWAWLWVVRPAGSLLGSRFLTISWPASVAATQPSQRSVARFANDPRRSHLVTNLRPPMRTGDHNALAARLLDLLLG